MTDVNELLATLIRWTMDGEIRINPPELLAEEFDALHAEMLVGHWPNDWREAFVVNAAEVIEKKAKVIAELEVANETLETDRDRWKRRALAAEAGTRELT